MQATSALKISNTHVALLLIHGLLNDILSWPDNIALNDRTIVNNEFKIMWKEAAVAYIRQRLSVSIAESPGQHSKPETPKH
jgi:hypothetical protein